MKQLILIKLLITGFIISSFGCGCGGPINELKIDIDSSDAIFIGEIKEINKRHTFHQRGGNGLGLKYINFDVIKTYRGLNFAQLKVTLFDSDSNSSCEGIIWGKNIGDTVLVFANNMNRRMIGSYLCGRHPTFNNLSIQERNFIDTANWIDPRSNHLDADEHYKRNFGESEKKEITEQIKKRNGKSLNLPIVLSIGLNLILITYLMINRKRFKR